MGKLLATSVLRISKLLPVLLLMVAASTQQAVAQQNASHAIFGYVYDAETRAPLPGANVFLDGTLRGSATGAEGFFRITGVPEGAYTLVVSMIGYEPQEVVITMPEAAQRRFRFQLSSETITLPGVTITGDRSTWLKRLERFKWAFFGYVPNASACELANPAVLHFEVKEDGTLIARASRPLRIINHALGYEIEYHLTRFATRGSKGREWFRRTGYGRFHKLKPESEEQRRAWHEARLRAYYGSFRHFVRSVVAGKLEEEGFRVYRINIIEYTRGPRGGIRVRTGPQAGAQRIYDASKLMRPAQSDEMFYLTFGDYDHLLVIYFDEPALQQYVRLLYRGTGPAPAPGRGRQISWIGSAYSMVLLSERTGEAFEPYVPTLNGYWGWSERVANLLPRGYIPAEALDERERVSAHSNRRGDTSSAVPAPGTARVAVTVRQCEKLGDATYRCRLEIQQIHAYGAATPPLATGTEITALLATPALTAPNDESTPLSEGRLLGVTLRHQSRATEVTPTARWIVLHIH